MSAPAPPLPTFLIIGAQKSATRWLRTNLGEHPDVFAAPLEISFFNQRYRRGPDFYRTQFEGWAGEPIVGEATPGYMMWRHNPAKVARRIKKTVPDVRLIALLRNPIDRANSAMVHHVTKERLPKRADLVDLVTSKEPLDDRLGLVTGGWYAASLQTYVDLFGDQLLVLLHDDVQEDPLAVYRRSLEHIGASPDFVPSELRTVIHSNQKRSRLRRSSSLSQEVQLALWPYFKDDVQRLESLIDRDLAHWDPTPEAENLPPVPADLVERQRQSSAFALEIVRAVQPEHLDQPTPCPEWTVADLLAHMVQLSVGFAAAAGRLGMQDLPEELQGRERADDAAHRYERALELLDEVVDDPLALKRTLVFGRRLPLEHYLVFHAVCQLGHAWDLAVAIGRDPTLPDGLAEVSTDLARLAIDLLGRATVFADEVAVDDDASPTDRFVAFLGRNPAVLSNV